MALRRNLKPSVKSPQQCPFNILDADTGATLARVAEWQGGREYAFETMLLLTAASDLLDACEFALSVQKNSHGIFDTSDKLNAEKLEAAIAKARGEHRA